MEEKRENVCFGGCWPFLGQSPVKKNEQIIIKQGVFSCLG